MKSALALSAALVLLSNGMTLFVNLTGVDRQLIYVLWMLVLLAVALWWARASARLTAAEMGLAGPRWRQSALIGAVSGLALAALLSAALAFPLLLAGPVRYREIQDLDTIGLLWRLGVEATVATALAEEILFRGILEALFKRSVNAIRAIIFTSVVFALWHLEANAMSVQQNTLVLPFFPAAVTQIIGYLGSLVAVGIGGVVLSVLRERTNHLAGSVALHWVAVAAMTILLYLQR